MDSTHSRRGRIRLGIALALVCALVPASLALADAFGPQTQITNQGPPGDIAFHAGFHAVAYNSATHRHLVVYVGTTTDDPELLDDIWGQLTDDDGNPVGDPFFISEVSQPYDEYNPAAVEYSPQRNEFLVAWDRDEIVYGVRLAADGTPITGEIPLSGAHGDIESESIAWNSAAGEYLVAWKSNGPGATDRMYGRRVAGDGTPIGASEIEVAGNDGLVANDATDVVYNATSNEYLAIYRARLQAGGGHEIYGQRLAGADASRIGSPDFVISTMGPDDGGTFQATPPSAVWNSTANQYLVAWSGNDNAAAGREVYGQLLAADGTEIGTDDFRISDMGPEDSTDFEANRPRLLYNPNAGEYFVAWHGDDDSAGLIDDEQEVFGQRLTPTGAETGTNDFRISNAGPDGSDTVAANRPAIAYNPNTCDYFVTWFTGDPNAGDSTQEWEIFGRRVDAKACPAAPPVTPPVVPPVVPPADKIAPVISGLKVTNKAFSVNAGKPRSTKFRYRLSEAARVSFRIERKTKGRRVGGRCVKATPKNAARKKCTRFVLAGSFAQQGKAGANSKRFAGKFGRRALKPGRYRAVVTARDAAGNRSKKAKVAFRVVRP